MTETLLWVLIAWGVLAVFLLGTGVFNWMPKTGADCECGGQHKAIKAYSCKCWCCREHFRKLGI